MMSTGIYTYFWFHALGQLHLDSNLGFPCPLSPHQKSHLLLVIYIFFSFKKKNSTDVLNQVATRTLGVNSHVYICSWLSVCLNRVCVCVYLFLPT